MAHLLQLVNVFWYITVNIWLKFSLIFYLMSFFDPGSSPETPCYICSTMFSRLWQFLRLILFLFSVQVYWDRAFLVLMTLTVLRCPGQVFCRMFLPVLEFFSWLHWNLGLGVDDHSKRSSPTPSHQGDIGWAMSCHYQCWPVIWLMWHLSCFSTRKFLF